MYDWGWRIIIYLFLGGLGAGAFLTSFAAEKGWFGDSTNLKRAGYFLAGPCVAIGSILLFFDLGVAFTDPMAVLRMFSNPSSVMTWGIYIITCFVIVGFISAFKTWQNRKIPSLLSFLGALLALATGTYTGVLLSVVAAVPFWNTNLLPILFVVSASSTGLAATSLFAHLIEKTLVIEGARTNKAHAVLVAGELILVSLLLGITISGGKGDAAANSARLIVAGSLAVPFWLLLIAIGLVIPLLYYVQRTRGEKVSGKFVASLSDVAILVGGLTLRAVVVLAVVRVWTVFPG